MGEETARLLPPEDDSTSRPGCLYGSQNGTKYPTEKAHQGTSAGTPDDSGGLQMARTLGLPTAILLMLSAACGTGIFVSPVGVTNSVGSVGLTLVIWAFCGVFSIVLALCYAELGSALPLAGGDYAYIEAILGPFPAFLCLWLMVTLVGPLAATMMGRVVGEYLAGVLDLDCDDTLIMLVTILCMVTATALNLFSVKWSARVASAFSLMKVVALGTIIVIGLVKLGEGNTSSFDNIWEGSRYSAEAIIFSIVPGFVTYAGWDCLNAMAEDMKNPKRDIPIVAFVGLSGVTIVYLLVNVSYFSVLSPEEFLQSSDVAMTFSAKVLPSVPWLVPTFVILSAMGSMSGVFLMAPRWTFAGGRNRQLPYIFSFLHVQYLTPVPAIILMMLLSVAFAIGASYFDIMAAVNMLGLVCQLKISLTLVALIYMKLRLRHLKGTIKVPLVVVVVCLILLLVVTATSVYIDPLVMGSGFGLFLLGIPLYGIQIFVKSRECFKSPDHVSCFIQQMLLVAPERPKKDI